MAKAPTPHNIAAALTVPERVLLFCLASDTDWVKAGVTHATAQHMMDRGLIEREHARSFGSRSRTRTHQQRRAFALSLQWPDCRRKKPGLTMDAKCKLQSSRLTGVK
jgi:hypothetical protein